MLDEEDVNEAVAERDKFETDYFAIRCQLQELINLEESHTTNGLAHSSFAATRTHRTQIAQYRFLNSTETSRNGHHFLIYLKPWFTMMKIIFQLKNTFS